MHVKELSFCHKLNFFLILLSSQPVGLNFWNFKLRLFIVIEYKFEISKVYDIGLQRYSDLKIWVYDNDSSP